MCDLLLEESNVHYVSTPVTVCGDIHGQVFLFNFFIDVDKSFVINYFFSFMTWKSYSELVDKYQTQTMFFLGILLTEDTIVWKPSHGCLH